MKRSLIFVVLLAVIAVGFYGCKSSPPPTEEELSHYAVLMLDPNIPESSRGFYDVHVSNGWAGIGGSSTKPVLIPPGPHQLKITYSGWEVTWKTQEFLADTTYYYYRDKETGKWWLRQVEKSEE